MKRWYVEFPDYTLKLYYKDLQAARTKNPKSISIIECFDYDYLSYVEKIKSSAIEVLYNYKSKRVHKILYNSGYILVRMHYDIIDGEEYYYDMLQFQIHSKSKCVIPITWGVSNPKEFWEQYINCSNPIELPIEAISLNELKALKPTRFWFRNLRAFYRDDNGYFYYIHKTNLPNKKSREEYEKFKGNKNAVFVRYGSNFVMDNSTKWFTSEEEFKEEYRQFVQDTPAYYGNPHYEIKQKGYNKKPPDDRKIVFRLPYFQIDKELKRGNQPYWIAREWCAMMEGYSQFGDIFDNVNWVEDLIKRWVGYRAFKQIKD